MASLILLDTHVLVWLYTGLLERIPAAVQARLNREQLALSPFAHLELAYLCEVGRIRDPLETVVADLTTRFELVVADVPATAVCPTAAGLTWTRDPFDRLLAAHALTSGIALVTKDEGLRRHLRLAWWAD